MFQKAKRTSKLILGSLFLLGFLYLVTIRDHHIASYNHLLSRHAKSQEKSQEQQVRINCSKDLYKSVGNHREHYQILAPNSTLTLSPTSTSFELVENLNLLHCIAHLPSDRQLKAKSGIYSYSEQTLTAHDLSLEIGQPQLVGYADHAIFKLSSDEPTFSAQNFKAYIEAL